MDNMTVRLKACGNGQRGGQIESWFEWTTWRSDLKQMRMANMAVRLKAVGNVQHGSQIESW